MREGAVSTEDAGVARWTCPGAQKTTAPACRHAGAVIGSGAVMKVYPLRQPWRTGGVRAYSLRRAAVLATARAVMFSTRRMVEAGVRMYAVAAVPIRIGPTVTPPLLVVFSTL